MFFIESKEFYQQKNIYIWAHAMPTALFNCYCTILVYCVLWALIEHFIMLSKHDEHSNSDINNSCRRWVLFCFVF